MPRGKRLEKIKVTTTTVDLTGDHDDHGGEEGATTTTVGKKAPTNDDHGLSDDDDYQWLEGWMAEHGGLAVHDGYQLWLDDGDEHSEAGATPINPDDL